MATLIENPSEGKFETVPDKPDARAVAKDFASRGITTEAFDAMNANLASNSDMWRGDNDFVKNVRSELASLSTEQPVQQPVQVANDKPIPQFEIETNFDLSNAFGTTVDFFKGMTDKGSAELALITSSLIGADKKSLEGEYQEGRKESELLAKQALIEMTTASKVSFIEEQIARASTSEETAGILENAQKEFTKPVSMLDFRKNYVVQEIKPTSGRIPVIDEIIERDAQRAEELDKMQAKIWEETSFLGVIADYGEIILPTGIISEEFSKYEQSLSSVLDSVRKAPLDKQQEVFDAMVETWLETETLLLSNNNSVLITDQLEGLENAIREGGLGFLNGELTEEQAWDRVETAINATFLGGELKGIYKGFKGLQKFLASRIFPAKRNTPEKQKVIYDLYTDEANTVNVDVPADAVIVEKKVDVRDNLRKLAEQKQPTKVRKALEKEKKDLGALKSELENTNVNAQARELSKEKKIKFKEAVREIKADREEKLNAIARRQDSLQSMIKDFDAAASAESQLSRIQQFLKDGRLTEDELLRGDGTFEMAITYGTRTSTSAFDAIAKESPRTFYNQTQGKTLLEVAEEQGLSAEEMAMRQMPTPSPTTERGNPNLIRPNELILIDEDELELGNKRARRLQRESGNTLEVDESATKIVPNDKDNSLGDFTFLFKDGADGFESASEAERAMRFGLVGVDNKRVVEKDGKWFVEVDVEHSFDARLDTKALNVDYKKLSNKNEYLLDPLRRLGEDVLKGIFALKGYNRSVAQKMQDELESIFSKDKSAMARYGLKPMRPSDTNDLVKALEHTDSGDNDWFRNIDEYADFLNKPVSELQNTWGRYKRVEKLMDDIYQIRNDKYRKALEAKGAKRIEMPDNMENLLGTPVKTSEGKKVYDPVTKELIEGADDIGDRVIVRLQNPILDSGGSLRRFLAVNPDSVKELGQKVLSQRKGHIDRFYRETGWTVKVKNSRIIDDVEEPYEATTHIVKTKEEADRIVAEGLENGEEVRAIRARENDELDSIYGDEGSVQYGYGNMHTKKRGNVLKGSDGMNAPTAGIIESLSRTAAGVERQLDVDMVNSLRARFTKEFDKYIAPQFKGKYSTRIEDMIKKSEVPEEVFEKAKQWHNYIESISSIQEGQVFKAIDRVVNKLLDPTGVRKLGVDSDAQALSSITQNFTTQVYIVGRPLFQVPQNALQLVYVAQKYPVEGMKAVANMPSILSALRDPSDLNIKTLAKSFKIEEDLAKALIDDLQNNGLYDAVGMSDDFMRMVKKSSVDASQTTAGTVGNIMKNGFMSPLRASKAGQENVLKVVNITAYIAEFQKQVIKGGRPFNMKTKADMSFNSQKITQTQNSINQFAYQNKASPLSIMFQFTQHVHKLWLDVIADPIVKLVTGKNIGESASPLASSRLQAAGSLVATYAIFGPSGVFGGKVGGWLEDEIAQIENEYVKGALNGNMLNSLVNGAVNYLGAEGKADISAKMNPASFLDTLYEFHIKAFMEEGTINAMGAVGSVMGQVGQLGEALVALTTTPGVPTEARINGIISEVGSIVAGVSDAERAYIAYNLGNYIYKGTLSGSLAVTKYEAVMQALNLTPAAITDRFSEFSGGGKKSETTAQGVAKIWTRQMHRELAEAQSFPQMMEIVTRYSEIVQSTVDPLQRQEALRTLATYLTPIGDKTTFDYIEPYINKKNLGDTIKELRGLRQDAGTDQMRQEIDDAIATLEPMVQQLEQFYEDK